MLHPRTLTHLSPTRLPVLWWTLCWTLCWTLWGATYPNSSVKLHAAREGRVTLRAVEQPSGRVVPVRMHLRDRRGRPVRPPRVPFWHDHFVFNGELTLELKPGRYQFEMERGPEYRTLSGEFTISRNSGDTHDLELRRFVDMKKEGWWSGDLHTQRKLKDIELLMQAEDLHVAPVISWWNEKNLWKNRAVPDPSLVRFDTNRYYRPLAGRDARQGGTLMFFNLSQPLQIPGSQPRFSEFPSPVTYLRAAQEFPRAHIDIEKPFWWDVPLWITTGMVDSIGLLNDHLGRDRQIPNEARGKPRDKLLYPNPHGNGRWSQHIYYQILNCGLRIPPSAGSASGVSANPLGYNRVYVYCGQQLTWQGWWDGLRAGRVVVTNGPLLRPRVNGQLPGHIFQAAAGETVRLRASLKLSLRDKVEYLEVIKNGKVEHEVRLDQYARSGGRLPTLEFQESGWMLVRAVSNYGKSYRLGSSGPYYVEIGKRPRISRQSAQFFLSWAKQRIKQIESQQLENAAAILAHHRQAQRFWQTFVDQATAE